MFLFSPSKPIPVAKSLFRSVQWLKMTNNYIISRRPNVINWLNRQDWAGEWIDTKKIIKLKCYNNNNNNKNTHTLIGKPKLIFGMFVFGICCCILFDIYELNWRRQFISNRSYWNKTSSIFKKVKNNPPKTE